METQENGLISHTAEIELENQKIILETGKVARQADGSVILRDGETMVFASACQNDTPQEGLDFLPLRVDYQEKFSSTGKTLGGFIKREGRPSEREILTSRLIDRPIRPLFPDHYFNEVQILTYVWSFDGVRSPDALGLCAASLALLISDIPFTKPLAAVRMGFIDGVFIVNPTIEQQAMSKLDLLLAGTHDAILMIEGYCDFLTEEQVIEAIAMGHESIKKLCTAFAAFAKKHGKEKKMHLVTAPDDTVYETLKQQFESKILEAVSIETKLEREIGLSQVKDLVLETLLNEDDPTSLFTKKALSIAIKKLKSNLMRQMILKDNRRIDGRALDEVRRIDIEMSFLPRTHGSCLFTRGETQAVAVCTLGSETMAQRYENLLTDGAHRFYLQYSFPPFSVGEVGRMGPPGRREVGHGKLAERALSAILPDQDRFPYVIRLESNITESNGSSSMASVCGGALALMNAGVPISRPVSGIAMGLILEDDSYKILSDIMGTEDALGDMDFKITGDMEGITAFQMDIKVEGITLEIMKEALMQAKQGRIYILEKMLQACPEPSKELSVYAPRIETVQIHPSKIGTVIGPSGKQIRAIIDETGVEMNISDDGIISIASADVASINMAKEIIHNLTAEVEVGKTYKGRIVSIVKFGLFVEIFSKQGLCHISEVSPKRVENLDDLYKVDDMITVKVLEINDRGQIKLSHKATLSEPAKEEA
ncbi:MAG: Polyribonucleotide nucleotidyltransferase [Chlamydiae bacterium]|nr:Polyribonucleotide nucleotidyltransferase [Chlamydiota bacterium]